MSGPYPAFELHDPLFVIGRLDFLARLHHRDVILPHRDRFPLFFSQPATPITTNIATTHSGTFVRNLSVT